MDGEVIIPAKIDTKSFDKEIDYLEEKLEGLIEEYEALGEVESPDTENMQKYAVEIEKTKNKIIALKEKQNELNNDDFGQLNLSLDGVGTKVKNIIKNVGKWALAVFGVRSAYNMVRQAVSTIAQYDKKVAVNLEYIRYVLAVMIKPVVEWLIDAVMKLISYINYISNAWFGYNLFKDAGVKDFQKAMGSSAKSAKEIKKELAGFDEMNVVQNTKSSSGSGSAGTGIPSMDFSEISDNVPKWVRWIGDNKDTILEVAKELTAMFLLIKGIDFLNKLSPLLQLFGFGGKGVGGGSLNTGLLLGSIATIVANVVIWRNAQKETANWVEKTNKRGQELNRNWINDHKNMDDLQRGLNNKRLRFNELLEDGNKFSHFLTGEYKTDRKLLGENLSIQSDYIKGMYELYKNGELNTDQQEQLLKMIKENYKITQNVSAELQDQGEDTKELNVLNKEYREMLKEIKGDLGYNSQFLETDKMSWRELNESAQKNNGVQKENTSLIEKMTNGITDYVNKKKEELSSQGKIKTMVDEVLKSTQAINDIDLKDKTFKVKVDKTSLIEMIKALPNKINLGFGVSFDTSKVKKAFGLAQGGIINSPGKGVPLGNNIIGGEAGREAVIPLNDETMDRLGTAIAKHMVINATMVNQMNGRVLSRELQQIMNEQAFGNNR